MKRFNDLFSHLLKFGIVDDEPGGSEEKPPEDDTTPPVEDSETPPTPPAEEGEEVSESDITDEDYDALAEKMSPRQVAAMNKRMREKIAKLETERKEPPKTEEPPKPTITEDLSKVTPKPGEAEFDPIEWVSDTEKGKTAIAHLKRTGMDDDQIRAVIDLNGIIGTRIAGFAVEPVASEFREGKFVKALEAFSKEDKNKFGMSKPEIRKAVDSYIRTNYDPKEWNNPNTIKAAYGIALADHPEIFTKPTREMREDIHDKSEGGTVSGGDRDVSVWAKAQGMDFDTKENRDISRKAYTAYKATMKKGE